MKILLFGATGQLGRKVLNEALKQKIEVTAICRYPEKLSQIRNDNLVVVQGDALDLDSIDMVFKNKDAIVSCIGEYKIPLFTITLYSDFTKHAIEKVKKYGIKKMIVCSAAGTVASERDKLPFFSKWIVMPAIGSILSDMLIMENTLKDSDINYIVIRPTHLVDCNFLLHIQETTLLMNVLFQTMA
ncbi:hypothetical protein HZS_4432 [Henneguya salminicola]|nr:hypothetical protein HZS_4432 [Henneguya salminicola]